MADKDAPIRPLPFRGGGFQHVPRAWAAVLGLALLIAIWQLAGQLRWVSPIFLPSPEAILRALYGLLESGALAGHVIASLKRILGGFALGAAVGVAVGLAIGLVSLARSVGMPIVSALFPIPKIAVLPLFILWFGIGEPSKIATIALGVFFPTVIATASGVDAVPRNLIRMAQSFNLPAHAIVLKIVLPGALPGILAGFRISASIALILVVAAEMIGAEKGIGAFVLTAGNLMQTDQLLAGVTLLSVLGLIVGAGLTRLERWLLAWR
ncbi:MAG: ABC transporter permease [Alphaproteobacteria bacterium]|nr:ABC transporter permease [Alphaproteobacteria bacterium]